MFNSCTVGSYIGDSGFTKDERKLIEALRKAGITTENVLEVLMDWYAPEKNPADVSDICMMKTSILKNAYEYWQKNG